MRPSQKCGGRFLCFLLDYYSKGINWLYGSTEKKILMFFFCSKFICGYYVIIKNKNTISDSRSVGQFLNTSDKT